MTERRVAVIGAGLAGCEVAWQLGVRGIPVTLFEMRPEVMTEAHQTDLPAELVCSNSFKSIDLSNAHGLLKEELKIAGSLIMDVAEQMAVPAGSALAVDRERFAREVKARIDRVNDITYQVGEVREINALFRDYSLVVISAGPLCSSSLSSAISQLLGEDSLYFYDAISPVVHSESIDMTVAYRASRYGRGDSDYINCPLDESEYYQLVEDLKSARKVPFKAYERSKHFEGCLPIEVMGERGDDTLAFGPLKPVGLTNPHTGNQSYAVLQLRQENKEGTLYNLVGCQTRMTWDEQKRVFRKIPGLTNCEFARMGSMHRNTYIVAPNHLTSRLNTKADPRVYLAGQITGVEGYTESTAMGLWVAMNIFAELNGSGELIEPDPRCMTGALVNYLLSASGDGFQPMNANFGLLRPLSGQKIKNKKEKRRRMAELALECWKDQLRHTNW